MDDFFKKKTKCDACPLTKAVKDKKLKLASDRNDYRIRTDLQDTSSCDILILTDTIEREEDLDKLQNLLRKVQLKNYVIAPAIACRTVSYELPAPLYSTYAFCDKFDITKYNPKVVMTTGKALFHFTKSSVFDSWREFIEIVFNETYFYPHIKDIDWKGRIYPVAFLPDIFACDTYEYYHFNIQVEYIKTHLENYEQEKITREQIENYSIEVVEDLDLFLRQTGRYKKVAIDTETNSLNVFIDGFKVGCVQLSFDGIKAYYIPFKLIIGKEQEFSDWLNRKFQIWANGKYDCKALNRVSVKGWHVDEDIPLIFHLLNTMRESNSIKVLSWYIGFGGYEDELDEYKKRYKISNYLDIPDNILQTYAGLDAIVTFRLYEYLHKYLVPRQQDTYNLYREVVIPVIPVFQRIEENGILVDREYVKQYHIQLQERLQRVEQEIYELAGRKFNIASNDDLGDVLESLGLPDYGRTLKGKYRTGIELLELWEKEGYAIAKKLVEYRMISKLDNTYVGSSSESEKEESTLSLFKEKDNEEDDNGIIQYIMSDGKVHGSILPAITSSWRNASNSPNLQNFPKNGEEGKAFRKVFIPPKDYYFCEADYSGFQLRLMGIYSEDEEMIKAFNGKEADLHSKTANSIFCPEVPLEEFLKHKKEHPYKEQRYDGKTTNLAFSFCQSPFSFQTVIRDNWSEERKNKYIKENSLEVIKEKNGFKNKNLTIATEIHKKFFNTYKGLPIYFEKMWSFAKQNGYIDCPIFPGLRRHVPEMLQIGSNLSKEKQSHYSTLHNICVNTGAQGGEVIIVDKAMIMIQERIDQLNLKSILIGTIHDSIICYCYKKEIKEMFNILKECMEVFDYNIPIVSEIDLGIDKDHPWGFGIEVNEKNIEDISKNYG